jgi:hypothetical protein
MTSDGGSPKSPGDRGQPYLKAKPVVITAKAGIEICARLRGIHPALWAGLDPIFQRYDGINSSHGATRIANWFTIKFQSDPLSITGLRCHQCDRHQISGINFDKNFPIHFVIAKLF